MTEEPKTNAREEEQPGSKEEEGMPKSNPLVLSPDMLKKFVAKARFALSYQEQRLFALTQVLTGREYDLRLAPNLLRLKMILRGFSQEILRVAKAELYALEASLPEASSVPSFTEQKMAEEIAEKIKWLKSITKLNGDEELLAWYLRQLPSAHHPENFTLSKLSQIIWEILCKQAGILAELKQESVPLVITYKKKLAEAIRRQKKAVG